MTEPGEPNNPPAVPQSQRRGVLMGRGLWVVIAVLAITSLLLSSRGQLPGAPVFVLVIAALGLGLWWLADRGGRRHDQPVAAPAEALILIAAVVGSILIFWVVFGWLD